MAYEYSSLAQSVERAAVNRSVVGSSPTGSHRKQVERLAFVYFIMMEFSIIPSHTICKFYYISNKFLYKYNLHLVKYT